VDTRRNGSGDAAQRARLARILSDPAAYFAEARRSAHDQARRLVAAQLHEPRPSTTR
jgi:hypothetical protein